MWQARFSLIHHGIICNPKTPKSLTTPPSDQRHTHTHPTPDTGQISLWVCGCFSTGSWDKEVWRLLYNKYGRTYTVVYTHNRTYIGRGHTHGGTHTLRRYTHEGSNIRRVIHIEGEGIYAWRNKYTEGNTHGGGIYTEGIYTWRNKYTETYTQRRYSHGEKIHMKEQTYGETYT